MSAKSEAAELAAKAAAKGALNLIKWGKKIIPATADEIAEFGPQAARVKAVRSMASNLSDDAKKITRSVYDHSIVKDLGRYNQASGTASNVAKNAGRKEQYDNAFSDAYNFLDTSLADAMGAESVSDLLVPGILRSDYNLLTRPFATGRRFDMTVPNAPESFTNIARSLRERGLISTPKDIELARRVSMLSPEMQQVYLDLVGEGSDTAQLLQALRLMGQ